MNKRLSTSLMVWIASAVSAPFLVHAADSSVSNEKAKPIEPVAKPAISKPSDALVSKLRDTKQPAGNQPEARPVETKPLEANKATKAEGSSQTPAGRAINDLMVMPGALSAAKTTRITTVSPGQESASDPLEDKVRVLLQDKLGKDGEVVLRVSPDTPVSKSADPPEPKGRSIVKSSPTLQQVGIPGTGGDKDSLSRSRESLESTGHPGDGRTPSSQELWDWIGPRGPQAWGRLDPSFAICSSGKLQSPPVIVEQQLIASRGPALPELRWEANGFRWSRYGPLWTANLEPGSQSIFRGELFSLESIQFRVPGEPFVGDKVPSGSIHFVHRKDGRFLIIALAIEIDDARPRNDVVSTLLSRFPFDASDSPSWTGMKIHPQGLMPNSMSSAVLYSGSLSYPPCSESVLWIIAYPSLRLPKSQLEELARLIGAGARPSQPLNRRPVIGIGPSKP